MIQEHKTIEFGDCEIMAKKMISSLINWLVLGEKNKVHIAEVDRNFNNDVP